jgi:hypothetical protein
MVKAYQRQNARKYQEIYCPNCDEWDVRNNWTEHTVWVARRGERWSFYDVDEDDDSVWYLGSEPDTTTVIEHDNCCEFFVNWEEREAGNWVCGGCNAHYATQDHARYCCT